jgi:hypothetical protein
LEDFTFQKPRIKVIRKVPEMGFIEPQFCPNWKGGGGPKSTARTKMVHKKGGKTVGELTINTII